MLTADQQNLVVKHMAIAKSIAAKQPPHIRDDMTGEAYLKLVELASKFDPVRAGFADLARAAIKNHLISVGRKAKAQKRSPGTIESLDVAGAGLLVAPPEKFAYAFAGTSMAWPIRPTEDGGCGGCSGLDLHPTPDKQIVCLACLRASDALDLELGCAGAPSTIAIRDSPLARKPAVASKTG